MTADVVMMGQLSTLDLAAGSLAVRLYQPFYFFLSRPAQRDFRPCGPVFGSRSAGDRPPSFQTGAYPVFRAGACVYVAGSGRGPADADVRPVRRHCRPCRRLFVLVCFFGLPASLVFLTMRFFTMGHGRAGPQLLATFAGVAFNLVANPVLAHGYGPLPALGLGGIALATTLTYLVMCFCLGLMIGLRAPFAQTQPYRRWWVIDLSLMKKIGQVGWPNGFLVMSETGMFAVAAFLIGLFGAAPLAAAGIANQIAAMAFMIPLSIAQACVIRVGRSAGAENLAGVKHYGNGGIWLGCLIVVPLTLGIWIFAEQLGFWLSSQMTG